MEIENAMFQIWKASDQSTVSTMGTIAIAAQAMTNIMENQTASWPRYHQPGDGHPAVCMNEAGRRRGGYYIKN